MTTDEDGIARCRDWLKVADLYSNDPSRGPDGEPDAPRGDYDALWLWEGLVGNDTLDKPNPRS